MFGQIPNRKLLSNSIIGLENKNVAAVQEALDGERFTELKLAKTEQPCVVASRKLMLIVQF